MLSLQKFDIDELKIKRNLNGPAISVMTSERRLCRELDKYKVPSDTNKTKISLVVSAFSRKQDGRPSSEH